MTDFFEQVRRTERFDSLKSRTPPSAADTRIYGITLSAMNADEIRIAAYWLAHELEKARKL